MNLLRAYDVSSNAFSLNQAEVDSGASCDLAAGNRYGLRLICNSARPPPLYKETPTMSRVPRSIAISFRLTEPMCCPWAED